VILVEGDLVRCSNASKPPCVELDLEMRSGRKVCRHEGNKDKVRRVIYFDL
jgi:hypothetical protein